MSRGADRSCTETATMAANPGILSIPPGFIGCWLETVLSTERGAERTYHELYVRSEGGLGAEKALVGH